MSDQEGVQQDWKQAYHSLLQQHELLSSIINAIPEPILAKNYDGQFVFANPAAAALFKTTPSQMVGNYECEFCPDAADFVALNLLNQAIMDRQERGISYKTFSDDATGRQRHFEAVKVPFENHRSDKFISIFAKDITHQTLMHKQSIENENRLSYALEISGEGLWDWDLKTSTVRHNPYWAKLIGKSCTEESFEEFGEAIYPDDREKVFAALNRMLHEGEAYDVVFRMRNGCSEHDFFWAWDRGKVVEYDENGEPSRVVGAIRDISDVVKYQADIERLAYIDQLTGLANRTHLEDYLTQQLASIKTSGGHLGVLFIDLDKFKFMNDTHGHEAGDELLRMVAQRLQRQVGDDGLLARFGGDELVVVLSAEPVDRITMQHHAQMLAERMHDEMCSEFEIVQRESGLKIAFSTSISIGVAISHQDNQSASELLRLADLALNRAKKMGRNRTATFDPMMQEELERFMSIERALRDAVTRNELRFEIQPKVDADMQCYGGEMLIRWAKEGAYLMPKDFLSVAEETNQVHFLGNWILREACKVLQSWSMDLQTRHLTLSVNVSVQQLQQSFFAAQVESLIRAYGIHPQNLILEITETVLMTNLGVALEQLRLLRAEGVRISIDDFGTGYSSLSYLKQLPIDELKIDRSFIADLLDDESDEMLVKTIITLGENFNLQVVAEGVETKEQFKRLGQFGCLKFQGFYCSKPLPLIQFERFVRQDLVKYG